MPALVFFFAILGALGSCYGAEDVPEFIAPEESPHVAAEGMALLEWRAGGVGEETRFELQQSVRADFEGARTRYEGVDRATYVSGLPEGDFYYRVRVLRGEGGPGPWSEPLVVRVEYVSMKLVMGLGVAGLVVFAATVATVVTGHWRAVAAAAVEP